MKYLHIILNNLHTKIKKTNVRYSFLDVAKEKARKSKIIEMGKSRFHSKKER